MIYLDKRRKKTINKRVNLSKQKDTEKQKYLKMYLIKKGHTLIDLKCEVILMICDMLIDNFIKSEEKGDNELLLENIAFSDRGLVLSTLKDLQKDIQENILTIDKVQNIINNQIKNPNNLTQSKLLICLYYFYNLCADALKYSILKRNNEDKIKWIPDLICISIIQEMIEKNYYFNKFTFIDNYNFDEIFSIYNRTNILIKKRDNISFLSKEKTIIGTKMAVSSEVVDRLINSKNK